MGKTPPITNRKRPRTAVVLALVLGIIGLMGGGHLYLGKTRRGIVLLVIGIILAILVWGRLFLSFIKLSLGYTGAAIFDTIYFVLWIWQTYDAYRLSKKA